MIIFRQMTAGEPASNAAGSAAGVRAGEQGLIYSLQMTLPRPIFVALLCVLSLSCGVAPTSTSSEPEKRSITPTATLQVSMPTTNAAEPAIAASSDGRVYVVWVEHEENGSDVLLREYDSEGNAKGGPVRVNPKAGSAKSWKGDPPTVKVGHDGTIYIGWTSAFEGSRAGNILYLSISTDGGQSFMPPTKVNDDSAPASHGMHSLAVDNDGSAYVAWLDERYLIDVPPEMKHHGEMSGTEPNAELYFAASQDKGRSFGANKKVASDVCPCCKTSITAPGTDGRMYIGYRQVVDNAFRHIAVTASSDRGKTFSGPKIVHDDQWKINACPVSGPSLFADPHTLSVAWYSGGDAESHGFFRATSLDGGNTFSAPMLIDEGDTGGTPVLLGDTVIFINSGKIFLGSIGPDNVAVKEEIGEGTVPASASVRNKLFIAFARPEVAGSSVWLNVLSAK
jgi:hypothetical protein